MRIVLIGLAWVALVSNACSREEPAPTPAPAPALTSVTEPAPPPAEPATEPSEDRLAVAVAEVKSMREQGKPDWAIGAKLKQLADSSEPNAIGAVLALMEDDAFKLSHRPRMFRDALLGANDPRIYPAALRVLERNLENGRSSWSHTWGYLDLVAAHGGEEGVDYLVGALGQGGQLAAGAAKAVAHVKDRACADAFLGFIDATGAPEDLSLAVEVAESLAKWNDPATTADLRERAGDASIPPRLQRRILRAIERKS